MVKTKIGRSSIDGIGLFADQFIPKGMTVWKYMPNFDLLLSKEEVDQLSEPAREQVYKYAHLDKKYGKFLLCSDDARFFNHSLNPNCDERRDDITTALRDIRVGEELVVNYQDFYGNTDGHSKILDEA